MNEPRWSDVSDLFARVVDLPDPERRLELDRLTADDTLKREVLELLAVDAQAGSRLEPPMEFRRLLQANEPVPGTRLGAWRLEREIARGGMGSVWLAYRDDGQFEKRAAIKLVSSNGADAHLASRFVNERQILADLEHPGIVSILDGGIDDRGSPYLVMEYVDGIPIDRFVAEGNLDLGTRARLVAELCDIVQFVHDKEIVHRDLKPSNVLVSPDLRIRLIDFGIAKSILEGIATDLTATHMRPLTPRYASPEQLATGVAGPRSDVFALGVILYELLTGESPYGADPDSTTLERLVREIDPPAPSTTVKRRAKSGRAITTVPSRDLDTIVAMALAKEPERRYATAADLGADLRRTLEHRPIRARRPSLAYRLQRLARRRRAWTVAVLAMGIAGSAIAVLLTSLEDERTSRRAETQGLDYRLALRAAARAIDAGESRAANLALRSAPEAQRAFEWRHLSLLADSSEGIFYRFDEQGARYPMIARPLDPAGERIVAACACPPFPSFRVLDGTSGAILSERSIAEWQTIEMLCADGLGVVATIEAPSFIQSGTARLLGITDPTLDRRLCDEARSIALLAEASRSIVGTAHGEIVAFALDGTELRRAKPHDSTVLDIAHSPALRLLATSSFDETIALLDPDSLAVRNRLIGHSMSVDDADFRPDGARLASVSIDRSLRIWDTNDGSELISVSDLQGHPACVAWPTTEGPIFVGFDDGSIREYDERSGRSLRTWLGCTGAIESLEFLTRSDGSRRLLVGDRDSSIRVFDLDAPPVREFTTCEYSPTIAFDPTGSRVVSPGPDGVIRVFDVESGVKLAELRLDDPATPNVGAQAVVDASFGPDGRTIVAGHETGAISIWDAESFRLTHAIRDLGAPARNVAHHPTRPIVVAIDRLGAVRAFDSTDRSVRYSLPPPEEPISDSKNDVSFTPDGKWLLALRGRTISWHDPDAGHLVGRIVHPTLWPRQLEPVPDSRHIVVGYDDGFVEIIDLVSTSIVRRFAVSDGEGWGIAVHPNEPRIAFGTPTGTIVIHDSSNGDSMVSFRGLRGAANDLAFSADGSQLATTSMVGQIRILRTRVR